MVPWAQFLKCPRTQSKAPCFDAPPLERRWLAEIDTTVANSSDAHSEQAIRYGLKIQSGLLGKRTPKCNLDNRAQDKILENELEMQSWKTNSRYNFEKRTHKTNFRYKTSIAGDSGHAPFIGDR